MDESAIEALFSKFVSPAIIRTGDEHSFALLPNGFAVKDVSDLLPPPNRVDQKVELLTVESFCAYVNAYRLPSTTVFADERVGRYEAVVDYHREESVATAPEDRRGTCDHVAIYESPLSLQWKAWNGSSGKWFVQTEFAQFLEANLRDVRRPAAANLMQVAVELQIHKDAQFSSEIRLDNGQNRFRYEETIRGTTKAGDLEIPAAFVIAIPVLIGGDLAEIEARFRYRLNEGKLSLSYELIRPSEAWLAAIAAVTKGIEADCPDVNVFVGARRS